MLKEKKRDLPYVAAIKLTTGEEIIARVVDESGDLRVTSPLAMVMAENPDNPSQTRVMFTPWMVAASDDTIAITRSHVVAVTKPRQDAMDQYEQAVAGSL